MSEDIKKAVINVAVRQVLVALAAKWSFFALSWVNGILGFLLVKLVTFIVNKSIMAAMFLKIDWSVDSQVEQVENKIKELNALPKDTPKQEREKKEDELAQEYIDLINFGRM